MVKYAIATLQAKVGAKLTGPIDKIHERPKFSTLWHLKRQLVNGLCKVGNLKFSLEGHASYILSKGAFAIFSSKEWKVPEKVGGY